MLSHIAKIKKAPKTIKRFSQSWILDSAFCYQAISTLIVGSKNNNGIVDCKNIYVDVSILSKNDNKTGIQRVVREVIFQLLSDNDIKPRLKFVAATKGVFYRQIEFQLTEDEIKFKSLTANSSRVDFGQGDVFIGLDFCPNIVPFHLFALMQAKNKGARFFWVLYDLLPVQYPEWFTDNLKLTFEPWLRTILLISDSVLCISKVVEGHARAYAQKVGVECNLITIRLGCGFRKVNQQPMSDSIGMIVQDRFVDTNFVLMVGTLEPRKGHRDIVAAFQRIWQEGVSDVALVIVGQKGWGVDELIKTINLPDFQNRIFWIGSADDRLLEFLYKKSLGVITASYDEGYGLPLVEAITYNKHIFARDIEVFKEVTNGYKNITYFERDNKSLLDDLQKWMAKTAKDPITKSPLNDYVLMGWENTLSDIKCVISF